MKRRNFLAIAAAATQFARAQETGPGIHELAKIVLPAKVAGKAADGFIAWIRDYRPGAEIASGYGHPREQKIGPNPSANYAEQLRALGTPISRAAVEAALAPFDRIPQRPNGRHVAADLLAFFYNSADGEDYLYGLAIKRDDCRGLKNSGQRPAKIT
jgi:hypothetical protein